MKSIEVYAILSNGVPAIICPSLLLHATFDNACSIVNESRRVKKIKTWHMLLDHVGFDGRTNVQGCSDSIDLLGAQKCVRRVWLFEILLEVPPDLKDHC